MRKNIAILFFLIAALAVIFITFYPSLKSRVATQKQQPTNFVECAGAGYPILESYPRQCTLPDGRFFVESNIMEH